MTRLSQLLLAAAAVTFVGCGYPETKMEEVGKPQVQTQQTPAPTAQPEATPQTQEAKDKKVAKTAG